MTKDVLAVADAIAAEVVRARLKHGPMKSAHEGYAVLLEEIDELWDEVKKRYPSAELMRNEAIQIGAMAARFVLDITPFPQSEPTAYRGDLKDVTQGHI